MTSRAFMAPCLLIGLIATMLGGCSSALPTVTHRFEGHEPEAIWTAMKAVAQQPPTVDEDGWHVTANEVWIDEPSWRMEVRRDTRRVVVRPGLDPREETGSWNLSISLDPAKSPPQGKFTSRRMKVPAWVWREAQRYFADVDDLLGGAVLPDARTDDADDDPEMVSPDDLMGDG